MTYSTHTHTHTHARTHARTHAHAHTYTHAHTCTQARTHTHTLKHAHTPLVQMSPLSSWAECANISVINILQHLPCARCAPCPAGQGRERGRVNVFFCAQMHNQCCLLPVLVHSAVRTDSQQCTRYPTTISRLFTSQRVAVSAEMLSCTNFRLTKSTKRASTRSTRVQNK